MNIENTDLYKLEKKSALSEKSAISTWPGQLVCCALIKVNIENTDVCKSIGEYIENTDF